jgi:hypothetical protein
VAIPARVEGGDGRIARDVYEGTPDVHRDAKYLIVAHINRFWGPSEAEQTLVGGSELGRQGNALTYIQPSDGERLPGLSNASRRSGCGLSVEADQGYFR